MIRLIRAETKRLASRRIAQLFPLLLSVAIVGVVVIASFVISADDDSDVDFVRDLAGGVEGTGLLGPVAGLITLMAFVIGASFVGADLKSGMLEHLLTWEPRRMRLLGARALALFIVVFFAAMLVSVVTIGALFGLATAVGTTDGTTGELWVNALKAIVRAGVAAGIFSAIGLGITMVLNNSVASIVGFVIYWFIVEPILFGAFLPKIAAYLPNTNAGAFSSGNPVERAEGNVFDGTADFVEVHSWQTAGVILAAWSLVAMLGGGLVFSRRDIA